MSEGRPTSGGLDGEPGPDRGRRSLLGRGLALSGWALLPASVRGALLRGGSKPAAGAPPEASLPGAESIPSEETIYGFIEEVFSGGVRRPGYPADQRAEQLCLEHFRSVGLEEVRLEPVEFPLWRPLMWSLEIRAGSRSFELPCFPLPHSAPSAGLVGELAAFDSAEPSRVDGRVSLFNVKLQRLPASFPVDGVPEEILRDPAMVLKPRAAGRLYDPGETLRGSVQTLPFGPQVQNVMEPSIEAGAEAFIGVLDGYPGDSYEYYVPYDGIARPIPGVWIRGSDGARLRTLLAEGPVEVELRVDSIREPVTGHNVVGELPGQDEDLVVVGSHHDGPWHSAVEDSSGVGLVMAQASYWAARPREERPHRLLFVVNAGHMVGGAGLWAFLQQHSEQLERIVVEIHLEHTAREFAERDGELVPTGLPEARWWFTSEIPILEKAVWEAIEAEGLERSMMIPPDAFAPAPTTDGGAFHLRGVPLVNYLTAPFYLFDSMDTLDKIDRASLEPLTRATIRIVRATEGVSAAAMRAGRGG